MIFIVGFDELTSPIITIQKREGGDCTMNCFMITMKKWLVDHIIWRSIENINFEILNSYRKIIFRFLNLRRVSYILYFLVRPMKA